MKRARPVFLPKFGGFLVDLREAKRWNQAKAAAIATQHRLGVGYQALRWLEEGKIENPKPELLKAVATLYDLPYEQLATMAARERYGLASNGEDAAAAKSLALERRISEHEATIVQARALVTKLVDEIGVDDELFKMIRQLNEPNHGVALRQVRVLLARQLRAEEARPEKAETRAPQQGPSGQRGRRGPS